MAERFTPIFGENGSILTATQIAFQQKLRKLATYLDKEGFTDWEVTHYANGALDITVHMKP